MTQLDRVQEDLNEMKEMMNLLLLKVDADTAVAAVRTERKLSEQKRKDQIKGIMVNNKHLFELAE